MTNRLLTQEDKREICAWKHDGEYAIHNLPPYEEMLRTKTGLLNPAREKNHRGFFVDGTLVGYVNLREEPETVCVGLGVRPE